MGDLAKIICVGSSFDLDISLGLTEEQYSFLNINYDKINDLSELKTYFSYNQQFNTNDNNNSNNNFSFLSLLSISSSNSLFNTLLFINRANRVKSFIEYIVPFYPKYEVLYDFMEGIVKSFCERNFIFVEFYNLLDIKPNITFNLKKIDDNGEIINSKQFVISKNNKFSERNEEYNGDLFLGFKFDFDCSIFYSSITELIKCKLKSNKEIVEFIIKICNKYPKMLICINYLSYFEEESKIDLETINLITDLLSLTDIFIFEKNEILEYFKLTQSLEDEEKKIKKSLTQSNRKKKSNSQDIFLENNYKFNNLKKRLFPQKIITIEQLFIQKINSKKKNSPLKIGIFVDELEKIIIIHQDTLTGLVLFHNKFYMNFYPNNINEEKYEVYKQIFFKNYKKINSIFLGGFLSRLFNKKSFKTCFVAGNESVKKVIDLIKNDMDFPNNNSFYEILVKRSLPSKSQEEIKNFKKEKNFILDCTNVINSKKKEYNALYDISCLSYFSNFENRKILYKQGFIDRKGFILGEPENNSFLTFVNNKKMIKHYSNEKGKLKKTKDNNDYLRAQLRNLSLSKAEEFQKFNINNLMEIARIHNYDLLHKKKLPSLIKKNTNYSYGNKDIFFKDLQKSKHNNNSSKDIFVRLNRFNQCNSTIYSLKNKFSNGNNFFQNLNLSHRNSKVIKLPLNTNSNEHKNKSNNGYIEKEEIDNKINNNLHNVNEKEIRNQKKERNHKIKNNVKNEKNKSIEILIQPYKDKGYMTQTDFRKIINQYENKLINSNKINKKGFQLDKE